MVQASIEPSKAGHCGSEFMLPKKPMAYFAQYFISSFVLKIIVIHLSVAVVASVVFIICTNPVMATTILCGIFYSYLK